MERSRNRRLARRGRRPGRVVDDVFTACVDGIRAAHGGLQRVIHAGDGPTADGMLAFQGWSRHTTRSRTSAAAVIQRQHRICTEAWARELSEPALDGRFYTVPGAHSFVLTAPSV